MFLESHFAVWPQWRVFFLFISVVIKGEKAGLDKKMEFDRIVGNLEPYFEATFQVV